MGSITFALFLMFASSLSFFSFYLFAFPVESFDWRKFTDSNDKIVYDLVIRTQRHNGFCFSIVLNLRNLITCA